MWPFAVRNAPGAKLCSVSVVGGLVGGSNVVTFGGTYSVLFMGGVDNHTVPFVRFSSFSALRLSSSSWIVCSTLAQLCRLKACCSSHNHSPLPTARAGGGLHLPLHSMCPRAIHSPASLPTSVSLHCMSSSTHSHFPSTIRSSRWPSYYCIIIIQFPLTPRHSFLLPRFCCCARQCHWLLLPLGDVVIQILHKQQIFY